MGTEDLSPDKSKGTGISQEGDKLPEGVEEVTKATVENWYEAIQLVSAEFENAKRMRFPILVGVAGESLKEPREFMGYVVNTSDELRGAAAALESDLRKKAGKGKKSTTAEIELVSEYGDYGDWRTRVITPDDPWPEWSEGTEVVDDAVVSNIDEALAFVDSSRGGKQRLPSGPIRVIRYSSRGDSAHYIVNTRDELITAIENVKSDAKKKDERDVQVHLITVVHGDTTSQTVPPRRSSFHQL